MIPWCHVCIISVVQDQQIRLDSKEVNAVMAQVVVKEGENLESALKRFKRSCARDGVMSELRKREHYEKPSVKRKKKSEAARKKANKRY